eukprot:6213112-Karenia_brevis.AAC.1
MPKSWQHFWEFPCQTLATSLRSIIGGQRSHFYPDTRVPMLVHIPGLTDGGVVTDSLVKHVEVMAAFLSNNGYKLREHNRWAKTSNFYPDTRAPF